MFQLLEEFDLSEGSVELILCDGENSQEKQNQDLVNLIDDPVDGIILIPYTMEGPFPRSSMPTTAASRSSPWTTG